MKAIMLSVLMFTFGWASGQSVLESHIVGMDTSEVYTIKVRNLNSMAIVQEYRILDETSRVTLYGGDYRVTYWCNDTIALHAEYIHVSRNDQGVMQKFILRVPKPLVEVDLKEFKFIEPEDWNRKESYMEF